VSYYFFIVSIFSGNSIIENHLYSGHTECKLILVKSAMLTDTTLIQKTLDGETEAFGLLVKRYQNRIYALVLNYIGNFADAQENSL